MSHRLTARSIDHVVLERGEVANSWRTERWDSLRLLTPNWHARLPGHRYAGDDPDGFMTVREVTDLVAGYARTIAAPLQSGTTVTRRGIARRRLRGHDRSRCVAVRGGRHRDGCVQRRRRPTDRGRAPRERRVPHAADVSQPRRPGTRRRAGRRGRGDRGPARRGDPAQRSPGHAGRRRARQDAEDVPRPRHLLVDRRGGHPRRALRRARRHRPRPSSPVAPTDRHAAAALPRPQLAAGCGRADRRAPGPSPRRRRPVLRIVAQHVRPGGPQDEPPARLLGRVGDERRHRRRRRPTRTLRAHTHPVPTDRDRPRGATTSAP